MKSDAKIALVMFVLIVAVIIGYVVFVPAKPASTAGTTANPSAVPTSPIAAAPVEPEVKPADAAVTDTAVPAASVTADPTAPTTAPSVTPAAATPGSANSPVVAAPVANGQSVAAPNGATQAAPAASVPGGTTAGVTPATVGLPTTQPVVSGPSTSVPVATQSTPSAVSPAGPADWESLIKGTKPIGSAGTMPGNDGLSAGPQVSLGTPPSGQPLIGSTVVTPAAPSSAISGGTYTIGRGDTLSTVAQKAYGSASLWPHIARANPEVNPNRLKLGTVLRIPDVATVTGATAAKPEPTTSNGSALVVDPAREYQIVSGDSLEKISRKLYGDASKVSAIYELNRDLIGADPARLKVRTVLKLPSPPTTAR